MQEEEWRRIGARRLRVDKVETQAPNIGLKPKGKPRIGRRLCWLETSRLRGSHIAVRLETQPFKGRS